MKISADPREQDVVLRDGSTVHVRPARAGDAAQLRTLFARLSPASLHSRFFVTPPDSSVEVTRLVGAAADGHVVIVGESGGAIVAVAGYDRNDERPDRAEVAFSVADSFQGRGVGTCLLEVLADIGRRQRISAFDAQVLGDNQPMMRVFLDSGFEARERFGAGVYDVTLALRATPHSEASAEQRGETAATASMKAFFEPRSVAVIGANRERGRIGSEVLHNITSQGFTGRVFAVHPNAQTIDGVAAFPSVMAIPGEIDLAVICVPADRVLAVVDDCIQKGVRALTIITAGFSETGADGRAREAELLARVRHAGIRMVGPNCMGLINMDPAVRLNATFAPVSPPSGRVAMSTQSGALGLAILDYAKELHIGFSTFVSIGNKADVSTNDLLLYWAGDTKTDVIVLYLESFGNPRKFSQIARQVGRRKPIVAVKAGRSRAGARAASSHTGALASSDVILDALFRQAGVIRTNTLEELFDVAALLANQPLPAGRRVAILTNAGGPAILAADACEAQGLEVTPLADATITTLKSFLPAAAATGNPVDMIASASAEHYERALAALLHDDHVDSVLTIFIPPIVTHADDVARAMQRAVTATPGKPVLGVFMSAHGAPPLLAPIPSYVFPEAAAVALARAAAYAEWRAQPAVPAPEFPDIDGVSVRRVIDAALARGDEWLPVDDAQRVLRAIGVAVPASETVESEDAAAAAADRLGYPVVLKAAGPTLIHKTEAGGVRLDLGDASAVRRAWSDLHARLSPQMTGALIQTMVKGGVEMLVGAVDDATFGPVMACGVGGTLAELLKDTQFRLHPLTDVDASAMVNGLRGVALLRGFRGSKPADETALRETLLRLSSLVGLCAEIVDVEINPLVVLEHGVTALDVRIRVKAVTA